MNEPQDNTPGSSGNPATPPTENGAPNNPQANPAANEGTPAAPGEKMLPQSEVNRIVAEEKRIYREKIETLKAQGYSQEQIDALEKGDAAKDASAQLSEVRRERVSLLLEKNQEIVAKLDPAQVEKLKQSDPEKVGEFLAGLKAVLPTSAAPASPQAPKPTGEMPSMAGGAPTANIPQEDLVIAEGIQKGIDTGDWTGAVSGLFAKIIPPTN
jgi:hypothetical protein